MNTQPGLLPDSPPKQAWLSWPRTRLGWWAFGLGLGTLLLPFVSFLVNTLLTALSGGMAVGLGVFGLVMLLSGIAGGIVGLIAVIRRHERSILVWAAILVGLSNLFVLGGEFLIPH